MITESIAIVPRPLCSLCRGEGFVFRGPMVARCPECERREWDEFNRGLKDHPGCYGWASCSEECMALCPWGEGCARESGEAAARLPESTAKRAKSAGKHPKRCARRAGKSAHGRLSR